MLCEECSELLSGMKVLLYLPIEKDHVMASAIADPKETFRFVKPEEVSAREKLLVASAVTDEKGNFEFQVDKQYGNTAFDIDFVCGTVPRIPPKSPPKGPFQFHITTFYPKWRTDSKDQLVFIWKYCLPARWWCFIRGHYFDVWTICGKLSNCQTGNPIVNAQVTAWDADFLTDDHLGTALTDASGHFRIDYTSIQFKQTFLSPYLNVETDPGTLTFVSGPDVYFKAVLGGTVLVDEKSSDARKNVGYCLCVDLCSKINVSDTDDNFPSAWTGIGSAFNISFGAGPKDFDADGYAGSGKFALTDTVRLTGQAAPRAASGNPIEYRFLVSDATTPNGGAAPTLANFTKIVGVTPGLFQPSRVAMLMLKVAPFTVYDVFSAQADFDADGWFDINNAIARTQADNGLGALADYFFIDEDTLISMDTNPLTNAPNVPNGAAAVGDPFPIGSKLPIEKVAIRFEIREVINKATNSFAPLVGSGKTLNSAILNNNPAFMKLAVAELTAAGDCSPISGTIHAKYTVYHPYLSNVHLHLHNNSNTINKYMTDGFLTLAGNTNPVVDNGNNNSLQVNATPNDLIRCTYKLTLGLQRRLHTGDSQVNYNYQEVLFFYDI